MAGVDSDLIRGHIDTIILKVLSEGDKYGYEICKDVEEKSGGTYELKQPTLYSCLKRLEGQGLISSYWKDSDIGGKRHYYKLTNEGKEAYRKNQEEWLRSRQIIDNLISNSHEVASSYSLVKTEEIEQLEKKAELAEELSEFIQEGEPSVYVEDESDAEEIVEDSITENEESSDLTVEEDVEEVVENKDKESNNFDLDEDEVIIPWLYKSNEETLKNDEDELEQEATEPETTDEEQEEVNYSWNRFVDLSNEDEKVLVEVAPNGEETAVYFEENKEDSEEENMQDSIFAEEQAEESLEENLSPAQGSIFEDEEVAFVEEAQPENEDEEVDILELLGHTKREQIENNQEELLTYLEEPKLEYSEELLIEHNEEPMLEYSEKEEIEEETEEVSAFSFNMDDFVTKSRNSYFDSEEDATPDYIAPTMKVDKQEEPEESVSTFNFKEFKSKHTDEEEIYTPLAQEPEIKEEYSTPVYHDFGANSFRPYEVSEDNSDDDDIYVDTSSVSDDEIYLNPAQANNEEDNELKLFSEDIFEENNLYESDDSNNDYNVSSFEPEEQKTFDEEEIIRTERENKEPMEFYRATENYGAITPKFTEDKYKEKISSLMSYTNDKEQYDIKETPYSFDNTPKDYADLKAEFEREGLVVRTHHKMVKESRHTRSYVEANKLNLINSWTTFGFVAFLISLTYVIMSNYASELTASYDFSFKYFLMGILGLAIIPVLYTLIFFINPYKKKPARYASRVYLLFAILLTLQFLLIIYCVNLQAGFYSFSQANYNHLFWIIPSLMSLYPLFDAILHTIYFNSKNFHV